MPQLERKHRNQSLIQFALALALLVIINILANARIGGQPLYGALDLTEDGRYTLTEHTAEQLAALEEPLFVRVLLAGDLPANFQRLKDNVEELLIDFSGHTDQIEWEFADPLAGNDTEAIQDRQRQLQEDLDILPVTVFSAASASERSANAVYPYAILYYGQRVRVVRFLATELPGISEERRVNKAEALLEYNFSRAIKGLVNNDKGLIGFTLGHGELPPLNTADLVISLREDYEVGPVHLDSFATIPQDIELLVVAKPTLPFSDFDAFKLDQYVMNGGKVLWAIDAVGMDYDSLQGRNEFYPQPRETGLEDLFFRYGFRLSPVLGLDLVSTRIGIVTGQSAAGPQVSMVPFPYHVMAIPQGDHPIVKNLDPVDLRFPTVIESVNESDAVQTTVLLQSSDRSRRKRLPAPIDLDAQKYSLDLERFNEGGLPFAYLLEGTFSSPYANRLSKDNEAVLRQNGLEFRAQSPPNRMVVVADGDILSNPVANGTTPLPLGLNRWEKFEYANKAFVLNAIEYLLEPEGVIGARGKEVKLRLIDKESARADATWWRTVNIVFPLALVALFGVVFFWLRRRRYARVAA
ncbi:gliding motility-associated ABC transporter substrate-binding protein GldG [Neolewinella lacunae]|uniref:Gliding motility-associated ABC transporter substrate-binding protein GldG n=1 Tax=Neolewinella lacunae TaxID=1517758 RepID=A0A923PMT6_9BACT|nr:gliding motility-associated ABC transporter substrate-binding protein GldG [Neolewinella lacunae]MBC6993412.1 gliding motility-associated ABC transporter substrate-binding protein GldG [Neolewinella lacunae]MDN3636312.1 gliding motility-associated ABC transporter substrate-binding protein GldG [Neolewinella lacunae]